MGLVDKCIENIIKYSEKNSELKKAHHFLFNLPIPNADMNKIEFVVMGMNPGEANSVWEIIDKGMQQETHLSDFHESYGKGREKVPWTKKTITMCGTKNVVQTEAFFWSSKNIGEAFEDRFGLYI